MKQRKISRWELLYQFIWLEYKKLQKPWDSIPRLTLLVHLILFLDFFLTATMGWYYPIFLHTNPRTFVILTLFVITVGMIIFSSSQYIAPAKGDLFPLNPFNFNQTDLNIVSQTSGSPMSWVLIGLFRTSIRVLWYVFLLALVVISYAFRFQIPLLKVILTIITLFVGFQLFMLTGAFIYVFVEEILENLKPRWREKNFWLVSECKKIFIFIIFFGGLVIISMFDELTQPIFEQIVLDLWFFPPFNVIYLVLASLSKTWPQTLFFPVMITLLIEWIVIIFLFVFVLGKIDPLSRLYERESLIGILSSDLDISLANFYIFSSFMQLGTILPNLLQTRNKFILDVKTLFRKDLLLLDKFRISLQYSLFMLFYIIIVVLWGLTGFEMSIAFYMPGILNVIIITLFLWMKESKIFLQNFKISILTIITEKYLLSFILAIIIITPFLILENVVFFFSGLIIYVLCFLFGTTLYFIKPSASKQNLNIY